MLMMNPFHLQSRKKALHRGIVMSIPPSAHADSCADPMQQGTIMVASKLTTLIGMMEKSCRRLTPGQSHF